MAIIKIPATGLTLEGADEIAEHLGSIGVDYERWHTINLSADLDEDTILVAYATEIESLKMKGNYAMADVIDIKPDTPGLDIMLEKFNKEHWHDEDEVRFVVEGHGLFHIAPRDANVISIEMEAGDLIRVPRGTLHWFNLCSDRRIRAIRLFQDPTGWTPHYTGSHADTHYQPMCLGQFLYRP